MKERIRGIFIGASLCLIVVGVTATALAASGAVTFNASNLSLNGTQISAKGENYTLANGQSVPASITYTDEKGGGTTYLPVRRIAELMGVETGWDGATGSVTVKGDVKAPAQPTTPSDTTASTDYSDWSKEDEAAYQEFKAMWTIGRVADDKSFVGLQCYKLVATGDSVSEAERIGEAAVNKFLSSNTVEFTEKCCSRFSWELYKQYEVPEIRYGFELYGSWGWADRFSADGLKCGYRDFLKYSTLP